MVDITEISAIVAAAGVIVGVVLTFAELRHQTKIRKTDMLTRLWLASSSREFYDDLAKVNSLQIKEYKDFAKQYGSFVSENPVQRAFLRVTGFYELMGTLLYRKFIDLESVYNITGTSYPKMPYEKLKPIFLGIGREFNEPAFLVGFEYLSEELTRKEPQLRKNWSKIHAK